MEMTHPLVAFSSFWLLIPTSLTICTISTSTISTPRTSACMGGSWSNTTGDWAFYVETIPEPATLGLLTVGGLLLLSRRR